MIIFDLDGTLADISHRLRYIDPTKEPYAQYKPDPSCNCVALGMTECTCGKWFYSNGRKFQKRYDLFLDLCVNDTPNTPIVDMFYALISAGEHIEIWTGRPDSHHKQTLDWLHNHIPRASWINHLKMRPSKDNTPDYELKEQWLLEHQRVSGNPIKLVFEDRTRVVEMYRRHGITCAQVASGDF